MRISAHRDRPFRYIVTDHFANNVTGHFGKGVTGCFGTDGKSVTLLAKWSVTWLAKYLRRGPRCLELHLTTFTTCWTYGQGSGASGMPVAM
jgi:hypothetical protein